VFVRPIFFYFFQKTSLQCFKTLGPWTVKSVRP
jgi:hypothetical protein